MAKSQKNQNDRSRRFYAQLMIYRSRQISLLVLVVTFIILFAILIRMNMVMERSWWAVAFPIFIFGSVFLLFPVTEEWEYKPWQAAPEQYETHSRY